MDPTHLPGGPFTRSVDFTPKLKNVSFFLHCVRLSDVIADDLYRYIFRRIAQYITFAATLEVV